MEQNVESLILIILILPVNYFKNIFKGFLIRNLNYVIYLYALSRPNFKNFECVLQFQVIIWLLVLNFGIFLTAALSPKVSVAILRLQGEWNQVFTVSGIWE